MKHVVLTLILLLSSNIVMSDRVLVIPGHYWSDGKYRGTFLKYFSDNYYYPYNSHVQSNLEARYFHTNPVASPAYSMCADPASIRISDFYE